MAGERLKDRVPQDPKPVDRRVETRADSYTRDDNAPDDPKRAAEALLAESDARTDADPAPRDPHDDRVDRRTSDMTTPPPDMPASR